MSCPAGRSSIKALAVKSLSGSASRFTARNRFLKFSLVEISNVSRDGRSARAHNTPRSIETSPDWRPCVITGRSFARLINGRAMLPTAVSAVVAPAETKKRRRETFGPMRSVIRALSP
jgi:hypothetical protein